MFVQLILYCYSSTVPLPGSQVVPVYPLEAKKAVYANKNMQDPDFGVYGLRGEGCCLRAKSSSPS